MTPRLNACFYAAMLAALVMLSGCNRTQEYDKRYYLLSADRQPNPAGTQTDFILQVSRFTIDSAYSGSNLVYRMSDSEYESDFYNEFLAPPSSMITDETRTWLSMSRLFRRVLDPGSQIDPTHVLEGNVTALYGDFRDKSSPKAIIEMRIFLLKARPGQDPLPVFGKTYKSSISLDLREPEGLVEAYDRCLQGILSTLEADLTDRLAGTTNSQK